MIAKLIPASGLLLSAVACLFPPWRSSTYSTSDGFGFILAGPRFAFIDIRQLAVELLAIAALTSASYLLARYWESIPAQRV